MYVCSFNVSMCICAVCQLPHDKLLNKREFEYLGKSSLIVTNSNSNTTKLGDEDGHCRHWEARVV
jgi:hypothetical protein